VVVRTVECFARLGPDLLKLPFPVDTAHEPDPATWAYWCDAVSERAPMPWTLLSGGGTFESFAAQVHTAHRHGCSGFMVGRALWGEAARAERSLRRSVIDAVVMPRWRRLVSITEGKVQR
jgi:tagatose-1,6-bisphosphate aldolase